MKKILTLVMVFMAVVMAYGREISGRVVGENDAPLDYVNVVLYCDSTYITGTVTDQAGMFSILTDASGELSAKISFVTAQNRRRCGNVLSSAYVSLNSEMPVNLYNLLQASLSDSNSPNILLTVSLADRHHLAQ